MLKLQWKLLNVITLGQRKTDEIKQIITITSYFSLVIYLHGLITLAVITLRASTVLLTHTTNLPCIHHLHCVSLPEEHFLNRRVTWNAFRVHWYHYVDGKPENCLFLLFLELFLKSLENPAL